MIREREVTVAPGGLMLGIFLLGFLFLGLTHDGCDRLKLFAVAQVHKFHAHRIAAGLANFSHAGPDHLTFVGDEHDLITLTDGKGAHGIACFLTGLHGDNTFATT